MSAFASTAGNSLLSNFVGYAGEDKTHKRQAGFAFDG
jgi:hypothetical protein